MFNSHFKNSLFVILMVVLSAGAIFGQTSDFTYQGRLSDGGTPANGNYDLQFALFDAADGSNQIGPTKIVSSVSVSAGVFTVTLDFGANAFPGANRFLEISTRPSGGGAFTVLAPRQAITSTPYAVRSLSSATADRATDAANATNATNATNAVTANNAQQLAGVAASQYVLTGDARLSDSRTPTVGSASYIQNGTAQQATSNFNISGNGVIGRRLGVNTSNPQYALHVVGQDVRVEGNTTNTLPRFSWNFTGGGSHEKKWQVYAAPLSLNFSALADFEDFEDVWMQVKRRNLTNIESVTFPAFAATVGIGTGAPQAKLHVADIGANAFRPTALRVETDYSGGTVASFGAGLFQIDSGIPGGRLNLYPNGTLILGDCPGCFPNVADRLVVSGTARILNLGLGGSASLCRNGSAQISVCSSSIRYKNNIADFSSGLNLVNRLRPVTFDWKDSQAHDLGLVAEEVAEAEPLLVTRNEKGEVEGVKYDRLSAVFINAFKEQQTQIGQQQTQIKVQENKIKAQDKALVMVRNRLASLEQQMRHPRPRQRKALVSRR